MKTKHEGTWVWYDLNTTDVTAALRFYGEVVGWKAKVAKGGQEYTEFSIEGETVGGFTTLRPEAAAMGAPPHWNGYIAVADAAATVARAKELGGTVLSDAFAMPEVGTFATLADPAGATFSIYQSISDDSDWSPRSGDKVGGFIWHELLSTDPDASWAFFSKMFGWEKTTAMDMGEMGVYQIYSIHGVDRGAVMRAPEEMPRSMFCYYATVDDVDAAAERTKANGGQVIMGPHDVPGGRIIQGIDPQGAHFSLHAARSES